MQQLSKERRLREVGCTFSFCLKPKGVLENQRALEETGIDW